MPEMEFDGVFGMPRIGDKMEIEIPSEFFITTCSKCGTQHAPIRDCPELEVEYDREEDYWKWSGNGE